MHSRSQWLATVRLLLFVGLLSGGAASLAFGQPQGGILSVRLVNGTTGGAGAAEKVTLFRLRNEMVPAEELGAVEGTFRIENIEVEGERPMLLQVTYAGVNYNEPVRFGRGYEADVTVTVYESTDVWDEATMEVTSARYVYRKQGDRLLVDKIFLVENRTSPPVTYYDPEGSFRFYLPSRELLELNSVSAQGTSGMPVPQQASPLPDGEGYVTKTAFKPGETELDVSYSVSYDDQSFTMKEKAFYDLPEVFVFTAPPDMNVDAPGWDDLGTEPQGRFAAVRRLNVPVGTDLAVTVSGGSDVTGGAPTAGDGQQQAPHGPITRIPDTTLAEKWVVVLLMAAALGYGLLSVLLPPRSEKQGG